MVIDSPLRFEPGTRYEYNSASFYLLGLVMKRVSGLDYVRFLDERLQRPLGMAATFDPRRSRGPVVTVQNAGVDNRVARYLMVRWLTRTAIPGGGLFGTLDDLVRFGAALLRPRDVAGRLQPLRPETIALMAEDQLRGEIRGVVEGEERPVHFGLGWGKPTLMNDFRGSASVVSHGGATGTRIWIDPDAGLVFVFFTNRWSAERAVEVEALRGTYEALRG
jgi:CubicO group peptidase (beta-lactamase class C family)